MYNVHSLAYSANSVAENTDITSSITPADLESFSIVGLEVNCSVAAKIELNETDQIICAPASSGYSARVNMGADDFRLDIKKIKIITACNINGLTVYYIGEKKKTLTPPAIYPISGEYPMPLVVTMHNADGETHYTTDGSAPSAASTLYSEPVILEAGATVKAISTKTGFISSAVTSATFTAQQPPEPDPDPEPGEGGGEEDPPDGGEGGGENEPPDGGEEDPPASE